MKEYGVDRGKILRPFWPGGNYERFEYPEGYTVVDNPPFSCVSKICNWYLEREIPFFLFAPYLTNFRTGRDRVCHIITCSTITYENGAKVGTAFVTNLDPHVVRTVPELAGALEKADKENNHKVHYPKYDFPDYVITAAKCGYFAKHNVSFEVMPEDAYWTRDLDALKAKKKRIFGSGFLLSEKMAKAKADAEAKAKADAILELSDREKEIIKNLG